MRPKFLYTESSALITLPAMAIELAICFFSAFFGQAVISGLFFLVFLAGLLARLFAHASFHRLRISVDAGPSGIFPGGELEMKVRLSNDKFLPVVWAVVFSPLQKRLCLYPDCAREPRDWERAELLAAGASDEAVCEYPMSGLLWYESTEFTLRWSARSRGLYRLSDWRLRTGDGFGLVQLEAPVPGLEGRTIAVYPRLVEVRPDVFLRNLWNADTGSRGIMEDVTLIRSTRDYQQQDSVKRINWRLAARGLPLSVNVFEEILPRSVHFLFDGESFSGPVKHLPEMEEALSILASEITALSARDVRIGLSLPAGGLTRRRKEEREEKLTQALEAPEEDAEEPLSFAEAPAEELLYALSAYEPLPDLFDKDEQKIVSRELPPVHGSVITVGMLHGGSYVNIIPDEVKFGGTIRALEPVDMDYLNRRVPQLVQDIAAANRAEAVIEYVPSYPPVVNDPAMTDFLADCARKVLGPEGVVEIPEPTMGAEDVTYYLQTVPGSYAILGSQKAHSDGIVYPHHNARFDIDESTMWIGTALFLQCVLSFCCGA